MTTIRHLQRFNRFDKGTEREVKEEDALAWEAEGLCEIMPMADSDPNTDEGADPNYFGKGVDGTTDATTTTVDKEKADDEKTDEEEKKKKAGRKGKS